ncbi:MAG: hypothetical protein ABJF01_22645 [bacterium]
MRFSDADMPVGIGCMTPHFGHTAAIASMTTPQVWQYFVCLAGAYVPIEAASRV